MSTRIRRLLNPGVFATVLISKALLLIFASQTFLIVGEKPFNKADTFLGIWDRWDASLYLKIAQNGYTSTGDARFVIVFFPLYPTLVAFGGIFVRDYLLSAFLVSAL